MKKLLAILLSVLLLTVCVPLGAIPVMAATSGTTGSCTWTLDGSGHLTISGNGKMGNYFASSLPWGKSITSVTIEDGVTTIGNYAFDSCSSLTSVTIGDSVTTIGEHAFGWCTSLTSVTIPDSVTYIGYAAFSDCTSLTSVTIPDSVTTIGDYAFYECTSLTSIDVDENNPNYSSLDGVVFNKEQTTLIQYPCGKSGTYTIPDSVTTIGDVAFRYCRSLTSITIPDSVTTIGRYAFYDCTGLTTVTIPNSVTTIGDNAFGNCYSLTSVTIPNSVTTIGDNAFGSCYSLTSVTIPDSVTTIGDSAFSRCTSLTLVNIGYGISTISFNAFSGCDALKEVYYYGDAEDREYISIYGNNNPLINATWHYNNGHTYDDDCDAYCNICHEQRVIPDFVHLWIEIYIRPTCVDSGEWWWSCLRCGYNDEATYIPATGHTYDDDCDADCNECGEVREIPDSAHEYHYIPTYYNCVDEGVLSLVCVICLHNGGDEVIPARGHSYSNACDAVCSFCGFVREVPDHVYSGACDRFCDVCGAVREAEPHTYVGVITTPNNCGNTGVMTHTCSLCGDNYTEKLPIIGDHVYDNGFDLDCNVCGHVREVEIPADAPAFAVEDAIVRVGDTFTVAVRTRNNSGIVSLKLQIGYDTDLLELVSVAEGDFADLSFGPLANTPFIVNWVDALHPNNTTDGTVVLLTFRVKEDAPIGETAVTVSYNQNDVYDYDFNNVAFLVANGTVKVVDYFLGDANGDGQVDNKDLGLLQRYVNEWDVSIRELAADMDGDGRINNRDFGLLQRYLNGWNVTLG